MKPIQTIVVFDNPEYHGVFFPTYDWLYIDCSTLESQRIRFGVHKGDRVKVVGGRKVPIGTEGTIKWCGINKYAGEYRDALTGECIHTNPSILLTLDDGSEVWTYGNNCINLTAIEHSVDGLHEFKTEEDFESFKKSFSSKYPKRAGNYWFKDGNSIDRAGYTLWGLGTQSYSIYQGNVIETETEVAAVIDDFRYDVYYFVRFSKEVKTDNLIQMVNTGTHRNMDDMWRGDTGLGDAIKAFKEYKESLQDSKSA